MNFQQPTHHQNPNQYHQNQINSHQYQQPQQQPTFNSSSFSMPSPLMDQALTSQYPFPTSMLPASSLQLSDPSMRTSTMVQSGMPSNFAQSPSVVPVPPSQSYAPQAQGSTTPPFEHEIESILQSLETPPKLRHSTPYYPSQHSHGMGPRVPLHTLPLCNTPLQKHGRNTVIRGRLPPNHPLSRAASLLGLKLVSAKYAPYSVDVDAFVDDVRGVRERIRLYLLDVNELFHSLRGADIKIPVIGGGPLNLFALQKEVLLLGGLKNVIEKRAFRIVAQQLELPATCTSAAFVLKGTYERFLYIYERAILGEHIHDIDNFPFMQVASGGSNTVQVVLDARKAAVKRKFEDAEGNGVSGGPVARYRDQNGDAIPQQQQHFNNEGGTTTTTTTTTATTTTAGTTTASNGQHGFTVSAKNYQILAGTTNSSGGANGNNCDYNATAKWTLYSQLRENNVNLNHHNVQSQWTLPRWALELPNDDAYETLLRVARTVDKRLQVRMKWEIVVLAVVECFENEINSNILEEKENMHTYNNNGMLSNNHHHTLEQHQQDGEILRNLGLARLICEERGCSYNKINNGYLNNNGRKAQSVMFSLILKMINDDHNTYTNRYNKRIEKKKRVILLANNSSAIGLVHGLFHILKGFFHRYLRNDEIDMEVDSDLVLRYDNYSSSCGNDKTETDEKEGKCDDGNSDEQTDNDGGHDESEKERRCKTSSDEDNDAEEEGKSSDATNVNSNGSTAKKEENEEAQSSKLEGCIDEAGNSSEVRSDSRDKCAEEGESGKGSEEETGEKESDQFMNSAANVMQGTEPIEDLDNNNNSAANNENNDVYANMNAAGAATNIENEDIMTAMNQMDKSSGPTQPQPMYASAPSYQQPQQLQQFQPPQNNDEGHSYPSSQAQAPVQPVASAQVHAQVNDIDEDTAATYNSLRVIYYFTKVKENELFICKQQGVATMNNLYTSLLNSRKLPRLHLVSVCKILYNCRRSLYLTPALLQAVVYRLYHAVNLSVYKPHNKQPFTLPGTHLHKGCIDYELSEPLLGFVNDNIEQFCAHESETQQEEEMRSVLLQLKVLCMKLVQMQNWYRVTNCENVHYIIKILKVISSVPQGALHCDDDNEMKTIVASLLKYIVVYSEDMDAYEHVLHAKDIVATLVRSGTRCRDLVRILMCGGAGRSAEEPMDVSDMEGDTNAHGSTNATTATGTDNDAALQKADKEKEREKNCDFDEVMSMLDQVEK